MAEENLVDINKLVKVSTFAASYKKENGTTGCSHPWIYKLFEQGEIEIICIDEVNFVKLD